MKGSDVVAESPADATRWRLLKDFLFKHVLMRSVLLSVSLWEGRLVKLYYKLSDEQEGCRELDWAQWMRLMNEDENIMLDELLGAVPFTDLKVVDEAEKAATEQLLREMEPVAAIVPEVKDVPEEKWERGAATPHRFARNSRVEGVNSGRRGTVSDHHFPASHNRPIYKVLWDGGKDATFASEELLKALVETPVEPRVPTPAWDSRVDLIASAHGKACHMKGASEGFKHEVGFFVYDKHNRDLRGKITARRKADYQCTYTVDWNVTGLQTGVYESFLEYDHEAMEAKYPYLKEPVADIPTKLAQVAAANPGRIIIGRPGASAIVGMDKPGRPAAFVPQKPVPDAKFDLHQKVHRLGDHWVGMVTARVWDKGCWRYAVLWEQAPKKAQQGVEEIKLLPWNQHKLTTLRGKSLYERVMQSKVSEFTTFPDVPGTLGYGHGAAGLRLVCEKSDYQQCCELNEFVFAQRDIPFVAQESANPEPQPEPQPEPPQVVEAPTAFQFKLDERVRSLKTGRVGRIYHRDDEMTSVAGRVTYGVAWDGLMAMQANCPETELSWERGCPRMGSSRILSEQLFRNVMAGVVFFCKETPQEAPLKTLLWSYTRYGGMNGMCTVEDLAECLNYPVFAKAWTSVQVGAVCPKFEREPKPEKRSHKPAPKPVSEPEPEPEPMPADEAAGDQMMADILAAVDAAGPDANVVVMPAKAKVCPTCLAEEGQICPCKTKPVDAVALAQQAKKAVLPAGSEVIGVRTVAGTGSSGLAALTTATKSKVGQTAPIPEAQLALGQRPDGWYYMQLPRGTGHSQPKPTLIEGLLEVGQLMVAQRVDNAEENDANLCTQLRTAEVINTGLAWYFGRLIGAHLKYAGDDEEVPDDVFEQFRDAVLSSPEPISLADLRTYVDMWAEDTGGATQDRCRLLLRLLTTGERCLAYASTTGLMTPRVEALQMGFNCDIATPAGYALHTSVNKAKPLFTKPEGRLLGVLLEEIGGK